MKQLITYIVNLIGKLSVVDMIVIIALMTFIILIISVIYLYKISSIEIGESEVNDMLDLKEITKQIEESPKKRNIELTPYEQEQEEKAIISYDELIKNSNSMKINYDNEDNSSGINVKRVDLKNIADYDEDSTDTKVHAISYQEEEAF